MPYRVLLTHDAENDLGYWTAGPQHMTHLKPLTMFWTGSAKSYKKLSELAERGKNLKELSVLCIREISEVLFKPYRIIYRL